MPRFEVRRAYAVRKTDYYELDAADEETAIEMAASGDFDPYDGEIGEPVDAFGEEHSASVLRGKSASDQETPRMRTHFGPAMDRPMCGERNEGDRHSTETESLSCGRCRALVRQAARYALGRPARIPPYVRKIGNDYAVRYR